MQFLRCLLSGIVLALAGCNGNLVVRDITPKGIVLVDTLARTSTFAAKFCLASEFGLHVDPLGDDLGVSDTIVRRTAERLRGEGYSVDVVELPAPFERDGFPGKYMISPMQPYSSDWDGALTKWMRDIGTAHHAGAVVFLTRQYGGLDQSRDTLFTGYGVVGFHNCLSIPPTEYKLYANVGINVFTLPDTNVRRYFTIGSGSRCGYDLPASAHDALDSRTFTAKDLAAYTGQLASEGEVRVQEELKRAKVLHGNVDACAPPP